MITSLAIANQLPMEVISMRGKHVTFTRVSEKRNVWKLIGTDEDGHEVHVFDQEQLFNIIKDEPE